MVIFIFPSFSRTTGVGYLTELFG